MRNDGVVGNVPLFIPAAFSAIPSKNFSTIEIDICKKVGMMSPQREHVNMNVLLNSAQYNSLGC